MGVWSDKLGWGKSTSGVFSEAEARKAAENTFLQDLARRETANKRFQFITIPRVVFRDATFDNAVERLRQQAQQAAGGVARINTLILTPLDQFPSVSLDLDNIPFPEALRYLCDQAGAEYSLEPYAIVIAKRGTSTARAKLKFPSQQPLLSLLTIPAMDLKQATLTESLGMLKQQATKLTGGALAINFVPQFSPTSQPSPITLNLRDIPFPEALRYVCDVAHVNFSIEPYAIVISDGEASKTKKEVPTRP